MNLTAADEALLLAAYFRGNDQRQQRWTSSCDQVVVLSLFYSGHLNSEQCLDRFSRRGYVGGLYDEEGELRPEIEDRYQLLIDLMRRCPDLIQGSGDLEVPAHPTFTACRLTTSGLRLAPTMVGRFPAKPDFPDWPDRRDLAV